MTATTYAWIVAGMLIASGMWHIAAPGLTERWLSRAGIVRGVGVLLLALALPCLLWRGWFYWTLFAGLVGSGLWRLLFPRSSIRAQQKSYPRWVHGCLMIGGALLIWGFGP